jgi:hypothetical protein
MRSPLLFLHIIAGTLGMLSGFVAVFLRKGSRRHGLAGNVFVVSMLCLSASGVFLAIMKSQPGNILGGSLTFYLVATAWLTARRMEMEAGILDWGALLVVFTIGAFDVTYGIEAAISPTGMKYGYPPGPYFFLGSVAVLATHWGYSHAGTQRNFWRAAYRAAPLAHVLCAVRRRIVHIPGTATIIPRFFTQDRRTFSFEFLASVIDDLLANSSSLYECIQEKRTGE